VIGWSPPGPLRAPSQSKWRWSCEWTRARWCYCYRWCHKALPLYVLKVVSSVPCWRWFGYTFTHSSVLSLLSPSHSLMMGSPHRPQFTHLLLWLQPHFVKVSFFASGLQPHNVRVFFFVVLIILLCLWWW
jgi:hypothetical protein